MSYDLKILAVKSEEVYRLNFNSSIQLVNEVDDGFCRYNKIWPYMTSTEGIWYSIIKEHDGLFDAFNICDSDFNFVKGVDIPYWIKDEDILYELTPLIIKSEFRNDFKSIVCELIDSSPIKTIMILASYQSHDKEIICGKLTLDEYFSMLENKKILFNVCYIVSA